MIITNCILLHVLLINLLFQRHPDSRFLRTRSIEIYDELRIIMGNEQATGNWSRASGEIDAIPAIPINTPSNQEHEEIPEQVMLVDEVSHDDTGNDTQGSSQQTRARPSSSSRSKHPSRKRSASDVMVEMMSAMTENIGRIADALTESNSTVCLDELFEIVQNIPGFDDDLIIEACEYLSSDDKRARMFMKLNDRLRKKWLLKRLRG